ncbi:hypothetical protein Tco_0469277 [Tanacetum coccineum]
MLNRYRIWVKTDRCRWLEAMVGISLDSMLGRMLGIRMGIMQYRMSGIKLFKMQFRIKVFRILEIRMANWCSNIGNGNVVAARAEVRPRRRDLLILNSLFDCYQKGRRQESNSSEEFDLMAAAQILMRLRSQCKLYFDG